MNIDAFLLWVRLLCVQLMIKLIKSHLKLESSMFLSTSAIYYITCMRVSNSCDIVM